MRAVVALGLERIGQTYEKQHRVFAFCGFDGFFDKALFVAFALQSVAVRIFVYLPRIVERVKERRDFVWENMARSTALIAEFFGELADYGDRLIGFKGKRAVVFEKNCAAFCRASCDLVVLFDVVGDAVHFAHLVFVCELDKAQHHFVDVFFRQSAVFKGVVDVVAVETYAFSARHFEIHARFDAFGANVDCAPVAHHNAFVAPLVAQYVGEKTLVV